MAIEPGETLVEFRNVTKTYGGDHKVLDDFSFKFVAGETHFIVGRSGAGKSTLIRTINYLEQIDDGEILIEGIPLTRATAREIRKRVTMVFQEHNLFPHMTVLDNVTIGPMHTQKVPKAEALARAEEYLDLVGLSEKAKAFPAQLSGGQKQRVGIARALTMEPDLILFDEPTSALDPEMVREVLEIMRKLAAQGRSMIVVSHEMDFARESADRISFLEGGKFIDTSAPGDFFNQTETGTITRFLRNIEGDEY